MTLSPQELRSALQQQRDNAQKLLQILDQEHNILSGKDLQGLETILAAKEQYIAQLEAASREYLAAARRHSVSPKASMAALLRECDPQGGLGLESLWRQVEKMLSQCREKNGVNGKIIGLGHRRVQQALAILRHGEPGSESCYSPTGNRPATVSSRTLGKV